MDQNIFLPKPYLFPDCFCPVNTKTHAYTKGSLTFLFCWKLKWATIWNGSASFWCSSWCNTMWTADRSCLHHHLHLADFAVRAGKWPILLLNCASSCSQSSAGSCGGALATSWFSSWRYHYWLVVGQVPNILPLSARIYCIPFCFLSLSFYTLNALNNAQLMRQDPSSVTSQYSEYGIVWQILSTLPTLACVCYIIDCIHASLTDSLSPCMWLLTLVLWCQAKVM